MVPLEYRNNPPQEPLTTVDKTGIPQNSAELKPPQVDILKPHTSALLGLTSVEVPTNRASLLALPPDIGQLRANRREQFEQTGYVPPIVGGQEQRRRRRRRRPVESEDELPGVKFANYLFDLQPNHARVLLSEILQQEHPDWDMKTVVRTVCNIELKYKMDRYQILNKKYGESDERVVQILKEIHFLKTLLQG